MLSSIAYHTHATLSDDAIRARVAHLNRMQEEELPGDPPTNAETAVRQLRNMPAASRWHVWLVRQDDEVVAQAKLSWFEHPTNRNVADLFVTVEPEHRRRGIACRLLRTVLAVAIAAERRTLIASSSDRVPAGEAFLSRFGFAPKFQAHVNQLVLGDLDHALMDHWLAQGTARSRDYALELWDGPVPEDALRPFAELANVMNAAPREGLDIEDVNVTPEMVRDGERCLFADGGRRLITVARHLPTNALAGYTELKWQPGRECIVWQGDTGVVEAHRNQGLGRWLKAANIGAMQRQNPAARVVRTGNADSNAPMLAINHQMGFRPFIAETAWQGNADNVAGRC